MKQVEHWIVSQIIHLVHNKLFREANISCPLMCAYQGVRNSSFGENFGYVING